MSSLDYRALSRINAESALTFQPLLFSRYWNALDTSLPVRILDFGAAQSSSIDFYSNTDVPCFITISDCIESLCSIHVDDDSDSGAVSRILDRLIPLQSEPYDMIIIWECLNYIHPDIFSVLQARILKLCHANTLVYGYLYTSANAAGYPCNFKIQNNSSFTCEEKSGLTNKPNIINSFHLKKYFCNFEISRSVLIRNGLQEFLMERKE